MERDSLPLLSESPETVRRPISEEADRLSDVVHKISNTRGPNADTATEASSRFEQGVKDGELPESHSHAGKFMRKYASRIVLLIPVGGVVNADSVSSFVTALVYNLVASFCWMSPSC